MKFPSGRATPVIASSSEAKLSGAGGNRRYEIGDLIDIEAFKRMMAALYNATGIPHGLIDTSNNILSGTGWQDICVQFHRVCPETNARCTESGQTIRKHLNEGTFFGYKCANGLVDYAMPIVINGEHIATLFLGQVLHEPPDIDYFRKQAAEFGFDETDYLAALARVPVMSHEQIVASMDFLIQLARMLVGSGLATLRQREAEAELKELNAYLAERVAERTASLEKANRAKTVFLASLSHEFRTPLNAILGFSEMIRDEVLGTAGNPKYREYAADIHATGQHLLDLINRVLDLSKIESGQVDIVADRFAIRDVIESVALIGTRSALTAGLAFSCEVAADVPETIVGDPLRLRQVLLNLIGNAMKFTRQGVVQLCLSVRKRSGDGDVLLIEVKDTGIGIAPDNIDRLFKEFSQVDTSIARDFGGSGLGLAIAKRLVELMDGEIGVESELGRGSRFWVVLPLTLPPLSD